MSKKVVVLYANSVGHAQKVATNTEGMWSKIIWILCLCYLPLGKAHSFSLFLKGCKLWSTFWFNSYDIYGPCKVWTHGHHRYFLTIVDDCTRPTWCVCWNSNLNFCYTPCFFPICLQSVWSQSEKLLKTDNALEFDISKCKNYFTTNGIVHETPFVDKPQQHGQVERKHRHLLEIWMALRFQANLPQQFLGDCVLTATCMINRLLTKVLCNETSFEKLLNSLDEYQHMRVLFIV